MFGPFSVCVTKLPSMVLAASFLCGKLSEYGLSERILKKLSDYRNFEYSAGKLEKLLDYQIPDSKLKLSDYQISDLKKTSDCPPLIKVHSTYLHYFRLFSTYVKFP